MRVCAAELICSTGVSGFQTFKPVFCIYNKLVDLYRYYRVFSTILSTFTCSFKKLRSFPNSINTDPERVPRMQVFFFAFASVKNPKGDA